MEKPRLDEVKGLLMVLWGAGDGAWVKASSSRGCSGHTTPTPGKAPSFSPQPERSGEATARKPGAGLSGYDGAPGNFEGRERMYRPRGR